MKVNQLNLVLFVKSKICTVVLVFCLNNYTEAVKKKKIILNFLTGRQYSISRVMPLQMVWCIVTVVDPQQTTSTTSKTLSAVHKTAKKGRENRQSHKALHDSLKKQSKTKQDLYLEQAD